MEIGIDIGTSYSSAAILNNDRIIPVKCDTGQCAYGSPYSIPSAVFAKKDGTLLIGQAAVASRMIAPSSYKDNFKRDFGSDIPYLLGDLELYADDLYIEFFRHFKSKCEDLAGKPVTKAYITYPANYTEGKKQKLIKAATYAGLNEVQLIDEPTAAALCYFEEESLVPGEKLLIYDFGGGTFDLALIEYTADGFHPITTPLGIENCGGVDFDFMIYKDIIDTLSKENDLSAAIESQQFQAMLSEQCIKLKHLLTYDLAATAAIPYGFSFLNYTIERPKYNQMILNQLALTCELVKKIVTNAGLKMSDIDKTLCVGGTTRTPFVVDMLEKTIGKKIYKNADPELAICCGAAAFSKIHRLSKPAQVVPSMPCSTSTLSKAVTLPVTEKRGNTIGNIACEGRFAYYNDWIYFQYKFDIYKVNINTNQLMKAFKDDSHFPKFIHILDGCIYYSETLSLHKININTGKHVELAQSHSRYTNIVDEWIYYSDLDDNYSIYRIRTDGTDKSKLINDSSDFICVSNGWIYYSNKNDQWSMYKIDINGLHRNKLTIEEASYINVINDWIYYINNGEEDDVIGIYKMKTDGSEKEKISTALASDLNVDYDSIYYICKDNDKTMFGSLYKMKIDGSNVSCLHNKVSCSWYSIIKDWIYYYNIEEIEQRKYHYTYCRIRTDGTDDQFLAEY